MSDEKKRFEVGTKYVGNCPQCGEQLGFGHIPGNCSRVKKNWARLAVEEISEVGTLHMEWGDNVEKEVEAIIIKHAQSAGIGK